MIKLQIDARPQGRPRFVNGITFDPPDSRKFKHDIQMLCKPHFKKPFDSPLKLTLHIARNFKKAHSQNFGDIDNLAKAVMDALTGIAWTNDALIVELHVDKFTSTTPYIIIELEELP